MSGSRGVVVGAGWLGAEVARQAAAAGAAVWTLQRSPRPPVEGTTAVVGDIGTARDDAAVRQALPAQADWVVLAVAPSTLRGDGYEAYPRAAAGAVAVARALGARALVYTSSTGVYGRTDGGVVRETDALPPAEGRPGLLREAEAILCAAGDRSAADGLASARVHVLRVAGLYGPGRDPTRRWAQGDPDDPRWINMAWRDDVVAAVLQRLAAPVPPGAHRWNCCDGVPVQAGAVTRALRGEPAAVTVPILPPESAGEGPRDDGRGHQRVSAAALRATGWVPAMPTVFHGLRALGHAVALPPEPLPRP
ncbi:MAG: NAD-dependent epimerase/dehydratase family protein [Gemmatimonadetes bacterium]|nr:NAD-dependent epimerase/dehydratase family protein [Gemmatimonadota bacterium]